MPGAIMIASRALRTACYGLAMRRAPATPLLLILALSLGACGAGQEYPSLERRAVERARGTAQPAAGETPPPPPAPASPELTGRLAQLVEQARGAHGRFTARRGAAERLVGAAGGTPGSESWSVATAALSDLESARSDAMLALAELDQLYTTATIASAETGGRAEIDAISVARDRITAIVGEEDQALAALRGRMRD